MILEATHRTCYRYPSTASASHNEVRLMPLTDETQICISFELMVSPPTDVFHYETVGGTVHHFSVRGPHRELEIVGKARVETLRGNPFVGLDMVHSDWDFYWQDSTKQANAEFLAPSRFVPYVPGVAMIAEQVRRDTNGVIPFLMAMNQRIFDMVVYDPDATHVYSTLEEVLAKRAGVCQDYAHLMIACCRSQGIPTRYVSGYLYGGFGIRGDGATHAWLECRLPDGKWLAFDPTNNLLASDHHIRVHTGRDYGDVTPTKGVYMGPMADSLEVQVSVVALEQEVLSTPRR